MSGGSQQDSKATADETADDIKSRKFLGTWQPPEVIRQLNITCAVLGRTRRDFVEECLQLGFEKYGRHPAA